MCSTTRPSRFTPGKDAVPIVKEVGWAQGPIWTGAENLAPPGFNPRTVQQVVSHYIDNVIPAHATLYMYVLFIFVCMYVCMYIYMYIYIYILHV